MIRQLRFGSPETEKIPAGLRPHFIVHTATAWHAVSTGDVGRFFQFVDIGQYTAKRTNATRTRASPSSGNSPGKSGGRIVNGRHRPTALSAASLGWTDRQLKRYQSLDFANQVIAGHHRSNAGWRSRVDEIAGRQMIVA